MITIGERIKVRRKELNLTIKQLHEKTGLSVGNISDMENNKYAPSTSSLVPLSQILDCSIDWIITGNNCKTNFREPDNPSFQFEFSKIENDLINMFRNLTETDREDCFEIVRMKYKRNMKNGESFPSYSAYSEDQKEHKSDPSINNPGIA